MAGTIEVFLPYGGHLLKCEVPERNLLAVAKPSFGVPVADEKQVIREVITKVIDETQVTFNSTDKVAIAVTDSTRPTPNNKILPILLDELKKFGVQNGNVTIIIATGMHRPDSPEEIRRNVGEETLRRVKIVNHDPDDRKNLAHLGETDLGTDIEVNKLFADGDVRITTGTVGPCMLAGWSGGGKTVMPGVSSRHSISQNHTLFVRNVRNTKRGAMFGIIENNLVRQDIDNYAKKVGVDFIVNVVQNPNSEVLGIYAGGLFEAHRKALAHAKKVMKASVPEKADIAIVSPGVFAHEVSLYQSGSRMLGCVEGLVKRGGSIILVSSCYKGLYEGIEEREFRRALLRHQDPEEILELTEKGKLPSFESCILYQFLWMIKHFSITVVTDKMSSEELEEIGMRHNLKVSEALKKSLDECGKDATITVVPYGSITYCPY